ncbi:Hypothetical predicted protein [Lecanosticta acicola]|uniref:Uncharacterized protein n=1 Tax=Lecanosticta acicola TaxID=111012 RepID=A0AAI9E7Y8_9PEZI|nr:Hypothetical predicted protein [Lecanosticta acicola]
MGRFSITSETAFSHPPEVVYDFAANPNNWGRTYKGSGGMHKDVKVPVEFGDVWTEKVDLPPNTYYSTWTCIRKERPWSFVIQQQNHIGATEPDVGGCDGFTTISYTFEKVGEGVTLFTRNLTCELPRGTAIPDDLLTVSLTVCCRPQGIEKYHDSIKDELDQKHEKTRK